MVTSRPHDYVIVGAGSAGCVLARRLSEDPGVRVLLIEAGGEDTNELIHMPIAFGALFRSDVDWDYSSHYEPGCNGRRIYLPRGKVHPVGARAQSRGRPVHGVVRPVPRGRDRHVRVEKSDLLPAWRYQKEMGTKSPPGLYRSVRPATSQEWTKD
jgi:hypothetical protein